MEQIMIATLVIAILLAVVFSYISRNEWHLKYGLSVYETKLILIRTARQFKNGEYLHDAEITTLEDALEFEALMYSTCSNWDKQSYLAVALGMVEEPFVL